MTTGVLVVTGTGTAIGKTHFAEALLSALAERFARVVGLKPIESGVTAEGLSDASRLRRASTFHVKPFGYAFAEPLSPHLAARRAGLALELEPLVAGVDAVRLTADAVVVELPGGLFTPLTEKATNADFARRLRPDRTILVAPDRLGVLHDVGAALRAARTIPLPIDGIVLVAPEQTDGSSGANAGELLPRCPETWLVSIPRDTVGHLAHHPAVREVVARIAG